MALCAAATAAAMCCATDYRPQFAGGCLILSMIHNNAWAGAYLLLCVVYAVEVAGPLEDNMLHKKNTHRLTILVGHVLMNMHEYACVHNVNTLYTTCLNTPHPSLTVQQIASCLSTQPICLLHPIHFAAMLHCCRLCVSQARCKAASLRVEALHSRPHPIGAFIPSSSLRQAASNPHQAAASGAAPQKEVPDMEPPRTAAVGAPVRHYCGYRSPSQQAECSKQGSCCSSS
jgi:hypothetical protein